MTDGKNIRKTILAVHRSIAAIPKDGVNHPQNYRYQAWEDVLPQLNAACARHKLLILQQYDSHEYESRGDKTPLLIVHYTFELTDVESGESIFVECVGAAMDTGDKGFAKAATVAYKNFALKTFQIPTREDRTLDTDFGAVVAPAVVAPIVTPPPRSKAADLPVLDVIKASKTQLSKFQSLCASKGIDYQSAIGAISCLESDDVPKWANIDAWLEEFSKMASLPAGELEVAQC